MNILQAEGGKGKSNFCLAFFPHQKIYHLKLKFPRRKKGRRNSCLVTKKEDVRTLFDRPQTASAASAVRNSTRLQGYTENGLDFIGTRGARRGKKSGIYNTMDTTMI